MGGWTRGFIIVCEVWKDKSDIVTFSSWNIIIELWNMDQANGPGGFF